MTTMADGEDYFPRTLALRDLADGKLTRCKLDENTEVCVARRGTRLVVFRDICPHMGGPLSQGRICKDRFSIECPWHGYIFDLESGRMTENPNDATFAPLAQAYASYKKTEPRYGLTMYAYDREGDTIRVKKRRAS